MLLKSADSKESQLTILRNLLAHERVSADKKQLIERELRQLTIGMETEKQAAFEIDFYFGISKNLWVIHDLRLEIDGRVAQIDHLVMNRAFEMYVLETKTFNSGLTINEEGEFSTMYDGRQLGIASPIAQNARHISVLRQAFKVIDMPKRLGLTMQPLINSVILVSPKALIERPKKLKLDASVIKLDQFSNWYNSKLDSLTLMDCVGMFQISSRETIKSVGEQLLALHKPARVDYIDRFKLGPMLTGAAPVTPPLMVDNTPMPAVKVQESSRTNYFCAACKTEIAAVVAKFCFNAKARFGGRAYCRACQATK